MDKIEVNGRTLEEAVQMAAQELKVGVDGVDYEILEEGSKGFLGLGGIPTAIKAWVREDYEAPAEAAVSAAQPVLEEEEEAEVEMEEQEPEPTPIAQVEPAERRPAGEMAQLFRDGVMKVVSDVLKAMDLDATATVRSMDEEEIWVDIVGKDIEVLIGKQGQTLDALQYLVGIAASRDSGSRMRVVLDADGYRDRHRLTLEKTAQDYAKAVKDAGQEAVLEPQSARDRRIIHMALAEDPDVYTYSEGEGDDRHVVISPKK